MFIEGETGHTVVCTGGSSVQKIQQMNALKTQMDKNKVYRVSMTIAKTCLHPNVHTVHAKFYVILVIFNRLTI